MLHVRSANLVTTAPPHLLPHSLALLALTRPMETPLAPRVLPDTNAYYLMLVQKSAQLVNIVWAGPLNAKIVQQALTAQFNI